MATYMSQHQNPIKPHQDFSSSTPPDQSMFHANNIPQRGIPAQIPSNSSRHEQRISGDYRVNATANLPNGNKPLPVPAGPHAHILNGGPRNYLTPSGAAIFDGSRSPPSTKNTSHVPCKFFKIGQCQAGKACPFSHSTDTSKFETPCKYFAKGNCKFGAKCALLHVLPNGRIVNRPNGVTGGHLNLGGRLDPQAYHHQESMLGNSLLAQQANGNPPPFGHQFPQMIDSDTDPLTHQPIPIYNKGPPIDASYLTNPGSRYSSPREEGRLAMSPVIHLSTLDAPLPASFDSQGISYIARHGPVAASVPSKFGLESPPSSLPKKSALPTDAIKNLHDSAYGRDNRMKGSMLASSPSASGDEFIGQRTLHSQRVSKPKPLSASLPRPGASDDWEDGVFFGGEEDYLPSTLSHLLNPEEKIRRFSSTMHDLREPGYVTPAEQSSKFGSPSTASPSRFSALFTRQKREEEGGGLSGSTFGHVGSPLRNSSLHLGTSPSLRSTSRAASGDIPTYVSSPPRQSSMSMISQQLQRTRLARAESGESPSGLHLGTARHMSNSSSRLDRAVSSSSINASRIEEEQGDYIFSLDEDEYDGKRHGSALGQPGETKSPKLGPIGGGRQPISIPNGNSTRRS